MKKNLFVFLFIVGFLVFPVLNLSIASAHEILPQELLEYIKKNPNATPEEIDRFFSDETKFNQTNRGQKEQLQKTLFDVDKSFLQNAQDFLKLGVEHILDGTDHILFVLSLLLVFVSLLSTLKLVSIFTVAHSVTLILAGTGVLTLSARIVEPLIALSIIYVAITSVFLKQNRYFHSLHTKQFGIFFFGLFHGLGFAGLLRDIGLPDDRYFSSLLFFNVGIEIGQILIISLVIPFILIFYKKNWYPTFIKVCAVGISGIALFWVIERIFF